MSKKNTQTLKTDLRGKDYFDKYGDKKYIHNKMMGEGVSRHLQIIAVFISISLYSFENYEQLQRFIQRTTRVAKRLDCYELSRIWKVLEYLRETADYKITLETVEKYILEDIPKLKGEEPIIILKDGSKIYKVKDLLELEKEGLIKYVEEKWIEI